MSKKRSKKPVNSPTVNVSPTRVVVSKTIPPVQVTPPSPKAVRPIVVSRTVQLLISILAIVLMLLPIVRYYYVLSDNNVNVPVDDDFDTALNFLSRYITQANSYGEKLKIIFAQHNEHRIVFDRLCFLTQYKLTGKLDFQKLIFIGNASLVFLVSILLGGSFPKLSIWQRLLFFLPVPLLLFQYSYWEAQVWAMASLQNLWVLVFAFGSLLLLSKSKKHILFFVGASLLALAATFTSGNGIFTFLAGIPILWQLKSKLLTASWSITFLMAVIIYFWGYEKVGYHPDIADTLLNKTDQAFTYFFTLTAAYLTPLRANPTIFGKFMLAIFIGIVGWAAFKNKLSQLNGFTISVLLFIYISSASVMAARSGFGVQQAFSARYGILSVLLLVGLHILITERLPRLRWKAIWTVAMICLAGWLYEASYTTNKVFVEERAIRLRYSMALLANNKDNLVLYYPNPVSAKATYKQADSLGIYALPTYTFEKLKKNPKLTNATVLSNSGTITANATPYDLGKYLLFFNSFAFINDIPSKDSETVILFKSGNKVYEIPTNKHVRNDIFMQYQSPLVQLCGFSTVIAKSDLPKGNYELWLGIKYKNSETIMFLGKNVLIQGV